MENRLQSYKGKGKGRMPAWTMTRMELERPAESVPCRVVDVDRPCAAAAAAAFRCCGTPGGASRCSGFSGLEPPASGGASGPSGPSRWWCPC